MILNHEADKFFQHLKLTIFTHLLLKIIYVVWKILYLLRTPSRQISKCFKKTEHLKKSIVCFCYIEVNNKLPCMGWQAFPAPWRQDVQRSPPLPSCHFLDGTNEPSTEKQDKKRNLIYNKAKNTENMLEIKVKWEIENIVLLIKPH